MGAIEREGKRKWREGGRGEEKRRGRGVEWMGKDTSLIQRKSVFMKMQH